MSKKFWVKIGLVAAIVTVLTFMLVKKDDRLGPDSINLPDGSSVRILAVTYGTNHVLGSQLPQMAAKMPQRIGFALMRLFGISQSISTRFSNKPAIVVWLEHATNGAPMPTGGYFNAVLVDGNNFISGHCAYMGGLLAGGAGKNTEPLEFGVFPRRGREIGLQFIYHDPNGRVEQCGRLRFRNPVFRQYDEWTPETLPVIKRAGDVEARLASLHTGYDENSYGVLVNGQYVQKYQTNRLNGRNYTHVDFKIHSLIHTNEIWTVANEEVSDATGNEAGNNSIGFYADCVRFMPSLWPREAAWKLKLEIKRSEGFKPEELFCLKNVPLGKLDTTNVLSLATNFGGISVALDHILRRPPSTNNSWNSEELSHVRFTNSQLPADTHLDLISATLDNGEKLPTGGWSSSGDERTYDYKAIPLEAKTVDFVFAVQKSRRLEYLVKPEMP